MVSPIRTVGIVVALSVFTASATGCATIFSGSTQKIDVRVYPEDATTTVDGNDADVSSGKLELERDKAHRIEVSKQGFETRRITVKQDLNGMFLVNLLFGPFFFIGMLVDGVSGSINELTPTNVTVTLNPADPNNPNNVVVQQTGTSGTSPFAVTFVTPTNMSSGTGESKPAGPSPTTPPTQTAPPPTAPGSTTQVPVVNRTMATAGQQTWVLAVMTTDLAGSTKAKAAIGTDMRLALTDQLRVFLAERGFRVVDRSSQEAALKAILAEEKKASYKACVDQSCQIPLGKALAASHIVKSTVAIFGEACTMNGELIDLRAEVTMAAGSARSGCAAEELLVAAEQLAEKLVATSASKAP